MTGETKEQTLCARCGGDLFMSTSWPVCYACLRQMIDDREAEIRAMRAVIDRLKVDASRMDWLARRIHDNDDSLPDMFADTYFNKSSLRQAIDGAMIADAMFGQRSKP